MAVSVDDIVKKEFTRSLMGYDTQEVDVFLDAIIDRIEKMEVEREELVTAMEKLLRRVERMEKAAENGKRALESGEKQPHRLTGTAASGAGPVRVQGGKAHAETADAEKAPRRKAKPQQQPTPRRAGETPRTDAPEPSFADAPKDEAPQSQTFASVAVEMETGAYAPDVARVIPELINDIESALLDGAIRPASQQDTPVRATDQSRVS